MIDVTIVRTANLPYNDCYPSPNQFFADIVDRIVGKLNVLGGIIKSATAPGVNDRDKLWYDTNDNQIYSWLTTAGFTGWGREHWMPPSDGRLIWWPGAESALVALDGGDANPVGDAAGPFWIRSTTQDGTFPLAKGDIPGTNPVVTVTEGQTGGEFAHTLIDKESVNHAHLLVAVDLVSGTSLTPTNAIAEGRSDGNYNLDASVKAPNVGLSSSFGGDPANSNATVAHNTMPPYLVGMWIVRTARFIILPP